MYRINMNNTFKDFRVLDKPYKSVMLVLLVFVSAIADGLITIGDLK